MVPTSLNPALGRNPNFDFGMVPRKPEVEAHYWAATSKIIASLLTISVSSEELLSAIGEVKMLFNRVCWEIASYGRIR
jgi:hypothetical protein